MDYQFNRTARLVNAIINHTPGKWFHVTKPYGTTERKQTFEKVKDMLRLLDIEYEIGYLFYPEPSYKIRIKKNVR